MKQIGTPSTKTHRDGPWCKQPSRCLEEVETDYAVILECCHEAEDIRRKYSVFLFIIGAKGRGIFNTWTWRKKLDENNQPTDENEITIKLLEERLQAYCLPKKNLVIKRRWLCHRIEELIIDLGVLRHWRWTDTAQARWWNRFKSSEIFAAMEGIKSQLRECYGDIQSRSSYKKATATDASRIINWKDK